MNEANTPLPPTVTHAPEAAPPPDVSAALPSRIGRYRVEGLLGEGGFGRVYLAHDDELGRPVAVKVPRRDRVALSQDVEAYLTEARTLAGLDHPHIVPVYDAGRTDDGLCFVASKYVEGSDLAKRLAKTRLSAAEAAVLAAAVAEALHYAHTRGLVHRDVKPANILLDAAGKAYLADFGLALKEQDFGKGAAFAGTPVYMSPEQARGEGHRVDGRSDVFSLGVVFYEMLTGRRPFTGGTREELLEQIIGTEARPPRMVDDAVPKELERICLKALARRAPERYTTARDMADDLRHFLAQPPASGGRQPPDDAKNQGADAPRSPVADAPSSDRRPLRIVPKGLRSFDDGDADFFLGLLPGPRDRDGLPEGVRFWKGRIEETDPDRTFGVGLIYGPSGCGKSSLVKAGLLPRLARHVQGVYVEATAEETERRLLRGLRKHCPDLPAGGNLMEAIAALRRGQGAGAGKKVLLIIDQFEQWLHSRSHMDQSELVRALRQCDGAHVQCVVLVRDDFWMAATRFMRELEIELAPGHNTAAVDLFDPRHARRVLAAFGRAFGALPEGPAEPSKDQEAFLDQAVAGLAQDGRVISVRLALFAEMVKGKPWTPAVLKAVGGAEGVGVSFLEETFGAGAGPRNRPHRQAARAVLRALLPEQGTDIKGNMRSRDDLLEASGYGRRPRDFDELLRILDGEVRLITPTEPEGEGTSDEAGTAGRYYQLTHDYLVPSLREWLTRKQKETRRGRAELRLAERSALWNARPENRRLPSLPEWLNIRLLARKNDWTPPQKRMMDKATRHHLLRTILVVGVVGLLICGVIELMICANAVMLVDAIQTASAAELPGYLRAVQYHEHRGPFPSRFLITSRLRQLLVDSAPGSKRRLRASLALLPVDPGELDYLYDRMLDADPDEAAVIVQQLSGRKSEMTERLWGIIEHPERGREDRRLRAAAALASYDPDGRRWDAAAGPVVEQLVRVNPVFLAAWAESLRPVREKLLGPLAAVYQDHKGEHAAERSLATSTLADYAAYRPEMLAGLLMDADEKQFAVLFPKVEANPVPAAALLNETIGKKLEAEKTDEDKEHLAKRQANAAVALLRLGQPDAVWPLLKHSPDPRVRSYLIHYLSPRGADPAAVVRRVDEEKDVSIRRALLLVLGEFGPDQLTAGEERLIPKVLQLYREDPDAGIHGAADWLLRQRGQGDELKKIDRAWADDQRHRDEKLEQIRKGLEEASGRREPADAGSPRASWYVNGQGQTMVVVPQPKAPFLMGSPPTEAGREGGTEGKMEKQVEKRIGRSFAIAARDVTVEQFLRFQPHYDYSKDSSPTPDCPVNAVSWFQAAEYCTWLTEQELPKEQWEDQRCYLPNANGYYAEGMKLAPHYLKRTGYRLPTEAEWEYACRSGAVTSRCYGESEELLGRYAWYTTSAGGRGMLSGGSLKPNDLGLFDMLGNAWGWCQDQPYYYREGEDVEDDNRDLTDKYTRVLRGGSFNDIALYVRSANRNMLGPSTRLDEIGFRPARTFP